MSNTLSFTELCEQHVELLPARTVLSMFVTADDPSTGGAGSASSGDVVTQIMGGFLGSALPK